MELIQLSFLFYFLLYRTNAITTIMRYGIGSVGKNYIKWY